MMITSPRPLCCKAAVLIQFDLLDVCAYLTSCFSDTLTCLMLCVTTWMNTACETVRELPQYVGLTNQEDGT